MINSFWKGIQGEQKLTRQQKKRIFILLKYQFLLGKQICLYVAYGFVYFNFKTIFAEKCMLSCPHPPPKKKKKIKIKSENFYFDCAACELKRQKILL